MVKFVVKYVVKVFRQLSVIKKLAKKLTDEELRAEIETQKTMFYLQQQDK